MAQSMAQNMAQNMAQSTPQKIPEDKPFPHHKIGDKVLCYEPDPVKQPVIYRSVIMDVDYEDVAKFGEESDGETVEKRDGENSQIEKTSGLQPIYLVHFQNWGHRNDRWVTENLVLPINPENLALKEKCDKQIPGNKISHKKRNMKKPNPNDNSVVASYKMNLTLPPTIKVALERDFVNVTLRNLLIALPRCPNVETILSLFVSDTLASNPQEDAVSLKEFAEGITTCFDFTLALQLLYKEERIQLEREGFKHPPGSRIKRQHLLSESQGSHVIYPGHSKWGTPDSPGPLQPSKIYGAEHLLRLFVKLPELADHMESRYLDNVAYFSQMFLEYVALHRAEVFVEIQPYKEADFCDT